MENNHMEYYQKIQEQAKDYDELKKLNEEIAKASKEFTELVSRLAKEPKSMILLAEFNQKYIQLKDLTAQRDLSFEKINKKYGNEVDIIFNNTDTKKPEKQPRTTPYVPRHAMKSKPNQESNGVQEFIVEEDTIVSDYIYNNEEEGVTYLFDSTFEEVGQPKVVVRQEEKENEEEKKETRKPQQEKTVKEKTEKEEVSTEQFIQIDFKNRMKRLSNKLFKTKHIIDYHEVDGRKDANFLLIDGNKLLKIGYPEVLETHNEPVNLNEIPETDFGDLNGWNRFKNSLNKTFDLNFNIDYTPAKDGKYVLNERGDFEKVVKYAERYNKVQREIKQEKEQQRSYIEPVTLDYLKQEPNKEGKSKNRERTR